jgi:hypothetical protein
MHKSNSLALLLKISLCAVLALSFLGQVSAEEKKVDGTWTWTVAGRNGGPDRKMTLKLKVEADKLTGVMVSPGRQGGDPVETKIADAKIKGEEISFTVTREFNGNKMVSKYNGKLAGDVIKGKIESERNGETQSRDWEAKRAPAAK